MQNKHSFFRIAGRLPFPFPVLRGLGGGWVKNGSPAGPISGRWSVPHPISNKRQPSPNRVSSQTHLIDIIIIVLYLGRK
jgi:hypothetical protein